MKKTKDVSIWWFFIFANIFLFLILNPLFSKIGQIIFSSKLLTESMEDVAVDLYGMSVIAFFVLTSIDLLMLLVSYYTKKRFFFFPRLQPKLLYLVLKPILLVTSSFALGDKILLSFFTLNNRLVALFPKEKDLNRIPLLLLPRCLQNSECNQKVLVDVDQCIRCGKCDLAPLIALKDKYEIEVFVAGGGGEAKKKLFEAHPSVVIAVACLDELMLHLIAILKYPLVAFSNEAGDEPCKNTKTDVEVISEYLDKVAEARK